MVVGLVGAIAGTVPMNREVFAGVDYYSLFQNLASFWLLRLGVYLPFVAGIALMPAQLSWFSPVLAIIVLASQCSWEFGLNLKLLKAMKLLEPASPRLLKIVQQTSDKTRVRVKEVFIMTGSMAQAYAMPTTNQLLFSNRLLEICDDAEISAICAHELGHLMESKATVVGRLFGSLALFPWLFIAPATSYLGVIGLVLIALLMFAILRFSQWLSLRMEKRADQIAKAGELSDGVYARALEKLYRENLLPAVTPSKQLTHPHLYDRLLAAGFVPDYPRPKAPASQAWTGLLMSVALGLLVAALLIAKPIDRSHINQSHEQTSQSQPFQLESAKPVSPAHE